MIIIIKTTKETVDYSINQTNEISNDQICRAITHLEIIKDELKSFLSYDYEVYEEK